MEISGYSLALAVVCIYIYTHLSNGNFYIPLKWQLLWDNDDSLWNSGLVFPSFSEKTFPWTLQMMTLAFRNRIPFRVDVSPGGIPRAKFHPLHLFHIPPLHPQYIVHYTIGLICPSIPFSRYSLFYIQYIYIYMYIHMIFIPYQHYHGYVLYHIFVGESPFILPCQRLHRCGFHPPWM